MNENNNENNMSVMDFNNYQNESSNDNQNIYQQTPTTNDYSQEVIMEQSIENDNQISNISINEDSEMLEQSIDSIFESVPVLDIEEDEVNQTPSDVFGVDIPNNIDKQPQVENSVVNNIQSEVENSVVNSIQSEENEKPKYGYASNNKSDLNTDENANIKFIILLAIIMLIVIILLPYLSSLI